VNNVATASAMSLYLYLLIVLHHVPGLPGEPVHQGIECSQDSPGTLCLTKDYSTFDLPYKTKPNLIKIGFEISDVLGINDKDYSITFGLYFSVEWMEPRLNLSKELWGEDMVAGEDDLVPVNLELIKSLWIPNIFIYNLKTFKTIDVLSKLAGLWIDSRKRIYYSQATSITFICPMLFDSFPLDTQVCKFQVGSYSYDMNRMVFDVSTLGYIQNTQSIILDYEISIKNLKKSDRIFEAGALGNFSLAGFEMTLSRHVMSYIITYYLPSGLFVVVSWISFLIPPDIVPGRMTLLITLFLVLVNIFNNVTTNSPKAEGLTAIEIWMLVCILFVFGALVVYAVILYLKQKVKKPNKDEDTRDGPSDDERRNAAEEEAATMLLTCQNGQSAVTVLHNNGKEDLIEEKVKKGKAEKQSNNIKSPPSWNYQYAHVDRIFLFFSPVFFLVFNSLYWGYFILWDKWFHIQNDD